MVARKGGRRRARRVTRRYVGPKKRPRVLRIVNKAIARNNNRMLETKHSCTTSPDGNEILHNNFLTLTSKLLKTTQGISDPEIYNSGNRIGDKITLSGVKLKMMIELNERYSDVTFRLLVVRAARGDTPTRDTLFNALSGNKMLDTINKERYSILYQKYFKIKAPNQGVSSTSGYTTGITYLGAESGIEYPDGGGSVPVISRGTKIISAWIPGRKFSRNKVITYNNNTDDPKFFDYHVVLYAYSNYTTAQDLWHIARVNDYISVMYYKDG